MYGHSRPASGNNAGIGVVYQYMLLISGQPHRTRSCYGQTYLQKTVNIGTLLVYDFGITQRIEC